MMCHKIKGIQRILLIYMFFMFFPPLWSMGIAPYPKNTYDLGEAALHLHKITSKLVADSYFQTANEVEYNNRTECEWYVTDKFEIGGSTYFILYQDCYHVRYFYLCRDAGDSFPQMILICTENMAGETWQYFEIDEENDILTIIDHVRDMKWEDTTSDNNGIYRGRFYITRRSFRLSDNFKLIDTSSSAEVKNEKDVYIQLY